MLYMYRYVIILSSYKVHALNCSSGLLILRDCDTFVVATTVTTPVVAALHTRLALFMAEVARYV